MGQMKNNRSITNLSGEALDKYLAEIAREPMITSDEEIQLAEAIRKGGHDGERAKEKLVRANLRFVVSVAKQYQHQGLPLTGLIDEGTIGLVKAAENFDETRGLKFIAYAMWWIRQSIMQAIAEQSSIIRLPLNQVDAVSKISQATSKSVQEHDSPTYRLVDFESMSLDLDYVLKECDSKACSDIECHEKDLEENREELGLTSERVSQIREKSILHSRKLATLAKRIEAVKADTDDNLENALEYGIDIFVYQQRRPFELGLFNEFVARKFPKTVIHSKGMCYFKNESDTCYLFEQKGSQIGLRNVGQWYATMPKDQLEEFKEENPGLKKDWDEKYGDKMQKLIFIGQNMDKKAIVEELNKCLTD